MKKRFLAISMLLILPLLMSGCGKKEQADMKAPDESGSYTYRNQDLGFSLVLPKEFEYYQTQRLNKEESTAIEIFVPTSDRVYSQEVEGYAKPLVVQVIDADRTDAIEAETAKANTKKTGEKDNKVYFIEVWEKLPSDWELKWTDEMENNIISSFQNI